ncbi:MAG: c-type cytochrome, partial [Myxococcota bacterium]|nr:c-type cytochrome [Myxococcota bacterium]
MPPRCRLRSAPDAIRRALRLARRVGPLLALLPLPVAVSAAEEAPPDGRALYAQACAGCHGRDGAGAPGARETLPMALPDFSDCAFATREPDADWIAVTHQGGPARGFSPLMPPFGGALTVREIERILEHVRTFCTNAAWPRGELNLPRPLVTTKAFPEDEAVLETDVTVEGRDAALQELVYERRVGPRSQLEIAVPFGWRERPAPADDDGRLGVGDVRLGAKHAFFHDLARGTILSAAAELRLPTGDDAEGFGLGTAAFEPYLAWGQLLPLGLFLHAQAGLELPFDEDRAEDEAFWRLAVGRSFVSGRFGRVWTPMVELLGARPMTAGADVDWDLVPQLQVTLNRRQHVRLALGVRVPVTDGATRDTRVLAYLLWDWFDGG